MKRITGYLAGLVISLGVLLFALKVPLQHMVVDFCLQRHCQTLFGAPIVYGDLHIAEGRLTLNNLQIVSPVGYTLSAQTATVPFRFAFPSLNLATINTWNIRDGLVTWHDDSSVCSIQCDPIEGALTIIDDAQSGMMRLAAGQWEFSHMPLHSLLRLASLKNSQWQAWKVESGDITGTWNATDGLITLVNPRIRHRKFPVALQAEQGQLKMVEGSHVTFDAPIMLSAAGGYSHFLHPAHWTLEVTNRDTLQWNWESPFGQAGRLSTTIHSFADQVTLTGDYQSADAVESFQFQIAAPTEGQVKGHILGKSLSLRPTLAPLANQFLEGAWTGHVDLVGDIQGPLFTASLQPRDLGVETANYRIAFEALTKPIVLAYDLGTNCLSVHLQTDQSSFLDKNTGLLLSEITATIDASESQWQMRDLEAYYQNLRFVGAGAYTKTDREHSELTLHVDAVTGRLSQLQDLLIFLSPTGLVQVVPLDGDVQLGPKGGDLSLVTTTQNRQLTVNAEGSLLDGTWKLDVGNLSIQEVGTQFTYAYPANTLTLRDLQGVIFVGRPGERLEEYQFAGERVTFSDYGKQQMQFDIWVGDRRRDVLRLAGFTEPGDDGVLRFRFDKAISHVGSVHPDTLELSLLNWSQVNSFQLGLNFRLDRFLHDLQRIDRTGLIPIDEKLSKGLQSLEIVDGLCRFDCRYERPVNAFDYHLSSDLLLLNHRPLHDFELKGNVQGAAWLVDPLRWNDLAFSAELVKFPDRWRIDFLGMKIGSFMLAGLEGNYLTQLERVEARINLLDVDLGRIQSLPLSGRWKSAGTLDIDLTEFPLRYPLHADLEGTIKGLVANGMRWDNAVKSLCEISSVNTAPTLKMQLQGLATASLGAQNLIKNATLMADVDQLRIDVALTYRNQPVWALFQTTWNDRTTGTLTLSDAFPLKPEALVVNWNQGANRLLTASQARGTLYGITADLKRDPRHSVSNASISAIGTVKLDFQKMAPLLPEELASQVRTWKLGSGYSLKGDWRLSGLLPETMNFLGELTGTDCGIADCVIQRLKGNARILPHEIVLSGLTLSDPALRMSAETLSLNHTPDGHWLFGCHQLVCEDVDPSKFTGIKAQHAIDLAGWSLPIFSVDDLTGYLEDSSTVVGTGSVQFLRSSRLRAANRASSSTELLTKIAVPDLALPVTGFVEWDVADRMMSFKTLKDVYSEGKLLKFNLLKGHPAATLDFDGRLNMLIRVKPTRPLLKLTDKSILSIQGTLKEPTIVLQDDK